MLRKTKFIIAWNKAIFELGYFFNKTNFKFFQVLNEFNQLVFKVILLSSYFCLQDVLVNC